MHDTGLREVTNPSAVFLAERKVDASGSAVVRPWRDAALLVEVQALVAPTSYGVPQRTATGFDGRRLQMLLAVLEKRAGMHLGQYDVFVNVAGGVRVDEPAADLGMAIAVASSLRDLPVRADAAIVGEVGLGGEIRTIHHIEKRIAEHKSWDSSSLSCRETMHSKCGQTEYCPHEVETIEEAMRAVLRHEGSER